MQPSVVIATEKTILKVGVFLMRVELRDIPCLIAIPLMLWVNTFARMA
ncbi:hypothetical protein [Paenibacillus sp. yr247]|nr:hypothetical protein [Paenibacillus sp. yr247]